MSVKFQQFAKSEMLNNKENLAFKHTDVVLIMLINVKMPKIVGNLTFMSIINVMLS